MAKKDLDARVEENAPRGAQQMNSTSSGSIDDKVKERPNFYNRGLVGKIFDYTIGAAAVAGAYSMIGPLALIGPATSIFGDYIVNKIRGKKVSSRQIRDNMITSSILGPLMVGGYHLMNTYIDRTILSGKILRTLTEIVPFGLGLLTLSNVLDYIVRPYKNKSINHMWEKVVKKYSFKNWRDGLIAFAAPVYAVANYTPTWFHYIANRIMLLGYRTTIGQRILKDPELDPYDHLTNKDADIKKKPKKSYAGQPQPHPT